jgi:hypothetical protein
MANSKLLKVMDYLINEQEDKARDLLHQIFIEKARAIHEEMLSDEEHEMGGDEGEDLGHDIRAHKEQIESEMHNGDGTMEDVDLDDAVEDLTVSAGDDEDADDVDVDVEDDDMDMDDEDDMDAEDDMDDEEMDADEAEMDADMDHDEEAEGERLKDIEQAIEELTAEFEAMKAELHGEHGDADCDEETVDEGWMDKTDDLDEDYDDLDEAIALDTVHVDLKKVGEVGSGKFSRSDVSKHSPVPKGVQSPVPGAKPVVTGKGSKADGYHLQSAPTSASMNLSNRRKKASEDMTHVSKEGSTKAMLNKDRSEGFGAANVRSPLGSTGTTPKK